MTQAVLGETYPATTKAPPPSAPGMTVHSIVDVSMYAGTPVFDRYIHSIAAESDEEKAVVLRDMPDATVVFSEAPDGEDFFPLPPAEFLDQLADLEAKEKEDGDARVHDTDPT